METLHTVVIRPYPGQHDEIHRQLGLLLERLPSLPELFAARFFRNRGETHTYLVLTTWNPLAKDLAVAETPPQQDKQQPPEQKTERVSRLTLPAGIAGEIEEWLLHYLWGYSRSGLEAREATVLFVSSPVEPEPIFIQRWIAGLRALAAETPLGQMFLAKSLSQTAGEGTPPLFLCYLGCPSEGELRLTCTHPFYEGIVNWLSRFAQVRVLEVAPLFPDYRAPA